MNIWFDFGHLPQYNFYKPLMVRLLNERNSVLITVLDRGKMVRIIRDELSGYSNVSMEVIGKHAMNKWSVIWDANIKRIFRLIRWKKAHPIIDAAFSNGYQTALIGKMWSIPNYAFDDDPQTIDYWPKIWFSSGSHYCLYEASNMKLSPKAIVLPVLKEWAYLNEKQFVPNPDELEKYDLKPYSYLFLREVTVGTMNYAGQKASSILMMKGLIPKDVPVLLSLEEKSKRDLYPSNWTLLQEPLKDVHSLIYYSFGLISSGDSMAREAALLGVPSYYLGIRYDMPANAAASKVAYLQNVKTMPVEEWLQRIVENKEKMEVAQNEIRNAVSKAFIDINEYMYTKLPRVCRQSGS